MTFGRLATLVVTISSGYQVSQPNQGIPSQALQGKHDKQLGVCKSIFSLYFENWKGQDLRENFEIHGELVFFNFTLGNSLGEIGKHKLGIFSIAFFVLLGFSYSRMANQGPRTYGNIFLMIFGTLKMLSKSGLADLPILTNIHQKIEGKYGIILKILFSMSENL